MYKNEKLDDYLNREFAKEGLIDVKSKPSKKEHKKSNKKAKKLIISAVALLSAAIVVGVGFFVNHFSRKNKKDTVDSKKDFYSISDIGTESDVATTEETIYTEATNNIDVKEVVSKNGKLYVNSKASEKSSEVGKSSVDTKGDTLVVKPNGKVYEKNNSEYQVVDKNGNVTSSGTKDNTGVPNGYVYDSVIGGYVKPEEAGKYIINENGHIVSKEDYEAQKNNTSSVSSSSSSNVSSSVTSSSSSNSSTTTTSKEEAGKYNADGTYTIYGLTFETKADFEQYVIQGYSGYAEVNGVMKPYTNEMEEAKQKIK